MASFTLGIKAIVSDPVQGSISINPPQAGGSPDYASLAYELVSGDNTIPVPSLASYCIILFDPTSTVEKMLKGDPADTGVALLRTGMNVFGLRDTLTSFVIECSANDTGKTTKIIFF